MREIDGEIELRGRGTFQTMHTCEETLRKRNRRTCMPSCSQQSIDLDEDQPRDHNLSPQTRQQLGGEAMSATFATVNRRDKDTRIADDQRPSRASTSSTRATEILIIIDKPCIGQALRLLLHELG